MRNLVQDITYSWRSLRKAPAFTATAISTLALAIAANTLVFSVVNASLLRSLPYNKPERLVIITWYGTHGRMTRDISASAFFMLKERCRLFQEIAAIHTMDTGVNVAAIGPPQYKRSERVSWDFFRTLGVSPIRGRDFDREEDRPGGPRSVVLSYGLWVQDYNKDPSALGSSFQINGEPYTIIGIMPEGFRSYPAADLWVPLRLNPATAEAGNEYRVIARLKDGIGWQDARRELGSAKEYRAAYPLRSLAGHVALVPDELQGFIVSGARKRLYLLFGAVVFVLLITCTNLALCLTVRGAARAHEFALRAAVGSSRTRLLRTASMDGVVIAFWGALIGALGAKEMVPLIGWLVPADLPLSSRITIDANVLLFTISISVIAAVLSSLTPAIRMARTSVNELLRQSPQTATRSAEQTRLARVLVTAQTALTLLLLAGTASLLHHFLDLQTVPPGFDPQHVSVAQISLAPDRYTSAAATAQLIEQIGDRIRKVPGVEAIASINGLPLEQGLGLPLYPADARDKSIYGESQFRVVSPEYFRALRIPLLAGRQFSSHDDQGHRPVAIVNETLARLWWPNQSPLGRYISLRTDLGSQFSDVPREVIGVMGDVHEVGLGRPAPPVVFVTLKQAPDNILAFVNRQFPTSFVVRSSRHVNLYDTLSRALAGADLDLAVISLKPLSEVVSDSLARPRFYVSLVGVFGAFALLLTAVGLYGLLSYQLVLRKREIAMRVAMGAKRAHLIALILKQGVGMVMIGIVVGASASIFIANSLRFVIYNTLHISIGTLATAALLLAAIAFLTSLVVAVRATAIEPMAVLRTE